MDSAGWVLLAAIAFVGTHFLLSHPWRRAIVARVGERGFLGIYSLVALGTFVWMVLAYRAAATTAFLWSVGDGLWVVVTVVMLFASILLMGSLIRNPASPAVGAPGALPETARGVFAVTRHPMLWAFALWGFCHITVFPMAKNIVVAAAVIVLALAGAALQDSKKKALQPDRWRVWEAKTSYWPFAAIARGRARIGGFGMHSLAGGVVIWIVATWAHIPLAGRAAGIWHWIR